MRKYKALAGLDMEGALCWYHKYESELFSGLPPISKIPSYYPHYPLVNHANIQLLKAEMAALIALFPVNAVKRTVLKRIVGNPPTWFRRDSTPEKPVSTARREEAISPTAIVPSSTDFTPWEKTQPSADIWLFRIGSMEYSSRITRIILSQGLVHEFGHTIIAPAAYIKGYTLKLPDGRIVDGRDFLREFAKMAEQHPPISHYVSTFRGRDNKFQSDNPKYQPMLAINEELAETIAAYLLGFAFCGDERRNRQPLADRPEIRDWVKNFLEAERYKKGVKING